jgi:hypothetical protein
MTTTIRDKEDSELDKNSESDRWKLWMSSVCGCQIYYDSFSVEGVYDTPTRYKQVGTCPDHPYEWEDDE